MNTEKLSNEAENVSKEQKTNNANRMLATRAIYAKENWKLIQEVFLELTKQRTIDMGYYGANCYAPITLDNAIDCCYSHYVSLHSC